MGQGLDRGTLETFENRSLHEAASRLSQSRTSTKLGNLVRLVQTTVGAAWFAQRRPVSRIIGCLLVAVSWPVSWLQVSPLGQYSFFPLWLGYILIVDSLVLRRKSTSILTRSPALFCSMFLMAIPLWWAFEGINHFTQNWRYVGVEHYSTLRYVFVASWHFSIVIPAVMETAELVGSFGFVGRFQRGPVVPVSWTVLTGAVALGILSLVSLLVWSRYVFPLTWLSVFLVLDPVNHVSGRPSVIGWLRQGDWRPVVALGAGALVCGWFWEMWNYWAMPKWEYSIAFVDFARVFEMPLLGYGGYLPFGLEVYAVYHFLSGLVGGAPRDHVIFNTDWSPPYAKSSRTQTDELPIRTEGVPGNPAGR